MYITTVLRWQNQFQTTDVCEFNFFVLTPSCGCRWRHCMLLQGMSYLESLAIVHRDLAARNVLGLFSSVSLAVLSFSVIPADSTAPDYFICPLLLSRGGSRGGSILKPLPFLQITTTRYNRYDTRCYFNVRSKADMSQLNLPHGNRQRKSGKQKKLKSKKRICSEVSVNSLGESM